MAYGNPHPVKKVMPKVKTKGKIAKKGKMPHKAAKGKKLEERLADKEM